MNILSRFRITKEHDKKRAVETLIVGSTPDFDYFFLVALSVLVATWGLMLDSAAIVIGSMLIAPILYSLLSLSLAISISDYVLASRALSTIGKSCVLAVGLAALATVLASRFGDGGIAQIPEIASRAEPSLMYFGVALLSGLAVAFTLVQEHANEAFPGIAVSVSLLPPLAVIGVGIGALDLDLVTGALALFAINALGVVSASVVAFSLIDLHNNKKEAEVVLEKEEKRVEKERKEIEKIEKEDAANHNHA